MPRKKSPRKSGRRPRRRTSRSRVIARVKKVKSPRTTAVPKTAEGKKYLKRLVKSEKALEAALAQLAICMKKDDEPVKTVETIEKAATRIGSAASKSKKALSRMSFRTSSMK